MEFTLNELTLTLKHKTALNTAQNSALKSETFTLVSILLYDLHILSRSVLLQKANKSDSGDYKCSVKNKWGNDHTTFNLG